MANRRKRPAEDTPEEETITTGTEVEDANPVSALLGLESGGEVMVYRSQPKYAKGFCEMMSAGDGGELASMIRKRWGGGRYCLRSKVPQQPGTNKTVWQKGGAAVIEIAGEPLIEGRRFVNTVTGELEAPEPRHNPAPAPMQPQFIQVPAHADQSDGLQGALLGLVQQAITGAQGRGPEQALNVVELIKSLQSTLGGAAQQQPKDPFGDLERVLGLVGKIRKVLPENESDSGGDEDGGGMFGGGASMEKMMMMMLAKQFGGGMFGGGPPQQPAPAAAPAMGGLPPCPGPNHVYHPAKGWIPEAPPAPAPATNPAPPRGQEDEDDPEFYDDPLTPDDIAAEILAKPEAEREAFALEVIAKLGGGDAGEMQQVLKSVNLEGAG